MTIKMLLNKYAVLGVIVIAILSAGAYFLFIYESKELTEAELEAFNQIYQIELNNDDFQMVTNEFLTGETRKKFKAVKKVFALPQGDYAFISKPVAYNGPVTLAVAIDGESGNTVGMRIVEHEETEHYVRDMGSYWFIDRFKGKSSEKYLKTVKLNARNSDEIVLITGATITTDGIVNGVNACMGVYNDKVLGIESDAVPYMVRFEKDEGEGPEETETIAIRAYGVVLGEVSLDDIKNMPSVRRKITINSTAGTTSHDFRGTLLANVIAAFDETLLSDYAVVQPIGVDDYISNISMEEVLAENKVYIMYEDQGEPLLKKNGKPGAMRVVVLDDFFGQRFTNYLIEIVLE